MYSLMFDQNRPLENGPMFSAPNLLLQVLPRLMPGRCGVSDQATALAEELRTACGIDTAFVVLNSHDRCDVGFPVVYCRPGELLDVCSSLVWEGPGAVLVHVSGYGYSPDGAPTLLAAALQALKAAGRFRVAAYFHELHAAGMPWRSAFWFVRRQIRALLKIQSVCDVTITSVSAFGEWLNRARSQPPVPRVHLLPVFSAVGESRSPIPFAQRTRSMAVFGLSRTRQNAYKQLQSVGAMTSELGVMEIVDIGPECVAPHEVNGVPVRRMGAMRSTDLDNLLAQTAFGFVSYTAPYLARSSDCAAFCAHGTIPVVSRPFSNEVDGLRDGAHVVSPKTAGAVRRRGLEECSQGAWNWYAAHSVRVHAATYARWMSGFQMEALPYANAARGTR